MLFQAHLLEQVQAAVIATDLRGRVTHWNEYAERLYGWSREETLGRDIRELTVSPDQIRAPRRYCGGSVPGRRGRESSS